MSYQHLRLFPLLCMLFCAPVAESLHAEEEERTLLQRAWQDCVELVTIEDAHLGGFMAKGAQGRFYEEGFLLSSLRWLSWFQEAPPDKQERMIAYVFEWSISSQMVPSLMYNYCFALAMHGLAGCLIVGLPLGIWQELAFKLLSMNEDTYSTHPVTKYLFRVFGGFAVFIYPAPLLLTRFFAIFLPWKFVRHDALPVEVAFMQVRNELDPTLAQCIVEKLKASYLDPATQEACLAEAKVLLSLHKAPTYALLHLDKASLERAWQHYAPALQVQVQQLLFAMQQVSALVAEGKPYTRLVIALSDPLGVESERFLATLAKQYGLSLPEAVPLGSHPGELLGRPDHMGTLTGMFQHLEEGPNAHLVTVLHDGTVPIVGTEKIFAFAPFDMETMTYGDPSLGASSFRLPLSPILVVCTTAMLPEGKDSLLGCTLTLTLDGPYQEEHYRAVAMAYLQTLLQGQGDAVGEVLDEQNRHALEALTDQACAERISRQVLLQRVHSYFVKRWGTQQGEVSS